MTSFRIVIAGESQSNQFAEACFVADYLSKNLPNFCYECIEKPVHEWQPWLCKFNLKNKWHHCGCHLIWKELLMQGSKPYYIGTLPDFLDYCHSYYKFDSFLSNELFGNLTKTVSQFKRKLKEERDSLASKDPLTLKPPKNSYNICITGANHPLAMNLVSGLLEMSTVNNGISKIFIFDENCSDEFMEYIERECSYVCSNYPGKVVKYANKIGVALTDSDVLIVLDHVPFKMDLSIGDWLYLNAKKMINLSLMVNASACREIHIVFANLGPACYNATVLLNQVNNIHKKNIVVATSDLGLDIISVAAEIAEIPMKNIFCPPVWGFVGINHLVDILSTVHKYGSFDPYDRYKRVRNSTLTIGKLTPEMRLMEYLMHSDDTLWKKVSEKQKKTEAYPHINKSKAILNVIKLLIFDPSPDHIINLGVLCDGSFGLQFNGIFSQPSRLKNGEWKPAKDYPLPKDPQMNLRYLIEMAELAMNFQRGDLPELIPYHPCICKPKLFKPKHIWYLS